jgi:hypothetical protein
LELAAATSAVSYCARKGSADLLAVPFRADWLPELHAESKIDDSKDNEIIVLIGLIAFMKFLQNSCSK